MAPRGRRHAKRALPLETPPYVGSDIPILEQPQGYYTYRDAKSGLLLESPPYYISPAHYYARTTRLDATGLRSSKSGREAAIDDLAEDFKDMGTSRRKGSTLGGRSRGRRDARHANDIDGFDECSMKPGRPSRRDEPKSRRGVPRHTDDVDSFDDEDIEPPRSSRRGGTQEKHDPRYLDDMDSSEDGHIEPLRTSTKSGPQGRRNPRRMNDVDRFDEVPRRPSRQGKPHGKGDRGHMDEENSFDESIEPCTSLRQHRRQGKRDLRHVDDENSFDDEPSRPSTRSGPQGRRGPATASRHMNAPTEDAISLLPRSGREARFPNTKSSRRHEMEAELATAEEDRARFQRAVERTERRGPGKDASRRDREKQMGRRLQERISKIKMDIYKMDPDPARLDSAAESFPCLDSDDYEHEERRTRHGRRGPAAGRGGGRGRHRVRHLDACDD